jgi:hypothetical protein
MIRTMDFRSAMLWEFSFFTTQDCIPVLHRSKNTSRPRFSFKSPPFSLSLNKVLVWKYRFIDYVDRGLPDTGIAGSHLHYSPSSKLAFHTGISVFPFSTSSLYRRLGVFLISSFTFPFWCPPPPYLGGFSTQIKREMF